MRITVITVCFNEEKNIAKTIESVLNQTKTDFEYIICDGKSTDKTMEIVNSYREKFDEKGIDFKVYSEQDGGVYYGMNNGIDKATGDYIIFINGGDNLATPYVIEEILKYIEKQDSDADVIYGSLNYYSADKRKAKVICDHTQLKKKMCVPHPASFCSVKSLKKYKFNTEYRIGADYDYMLNVYLNGGVFVRVSTLVSDFYEGGISTQDYKKSLQEQRKILENHGIKVSKLGFWLKCLKIDCAKLLNFMKRL